jgi:hypothetical protein
MAQRQPEEKAMDTNEGFNARKGEFKTWYGQDVPAGTRVVINDAGTANEWYEGMFYFEAGHDTYIEWIELVKMDD